MRMCLPVVSVLLSPPFPPSPTTPPLLLMFVNPNPLVALNLNNDLDFFTTYNREYVDPHLDDDPYFGLQISSAFYDINSLSSSNFTKNSPLYISINIQSLQSKFEQFKS